MSTAAAEQVVSSLQSSRASSTGGSVDFVQCNVTEYADNYKLFRTAYDKYKRVDHAVACAGILEQGQWFDPDLTIDSVGREQATEAVLDVNLLGSCIFARMAVVFLRDGMQKGENKSVTLLSSIAAFRESPGLYMYQARPRSNRECKSLCS